MKNGNQKVGDLGQHWTPIETVEEMLGLLSSTQKSNILEPTAGSGRFVRQLLNKNYSVSAIEIDASVVPTDLQKHYTINDFFLWEGGQFDAIIGNPPYVNGRLLRLNSNRKLKGGLPATANMYLHILEKCVKQHLKQNGEIVFIVPSSILSGTSMGSSLRSWMVKNGSFTHALVPKVDWETADVSTTIIRWVKGAEQTLVKTNNGNKTLVCNNGFIKLLDYSATGLLGDFFDIGVGAAAAKKLILSETVGSSWISCGSLSYFDETKCWPRKRVTSTEHKILVIPGPTRKKDVFYSTTKWSLEQASKHLDHFLQPINKNISTKKIELAVCLLNDFFASHDITLGLRIDGRWACGIKDLRNLPINKKLCDDLKSLGLAPIS